MRIRLSDIPATGTKINDSLSLSALNDRMNEGPGNEILFSTEPAVSVELKKEKGGVELNGSVTAHYKQECPRCLQEVEHELQEELRLTLKPKTSRPGSDRKVSGAEWEDDVGIVYFDGEHIDLEDIIQETLILAIDPLGKEHDGCVPLTWKEDEDEDPKNTLGNLFKKAGLN